MPIALDPDETFDVVLKTDQSKPAGKRPTFMFRHLTTRALRKAKKFLTDQAAVNASTFDEIMNALSQTINSHLDRWRNIDAPITDPELEDLCTRDELWELYYAMLMGGSLSAEEKKTLDLPSPANGAKSAEIPVAATLPSAEIAPARPNLTKSNVRPVTTSAQTVGTARAGG